jgi:origin recognition complex subunit 4
LAPPVVATPFLSSAKRKKQNTRVLSPENGTIFGSLRKGIGGMLAWTGKGKENVREEDEEDELADDDGTTRRKGKAVRDIFEVPNSDSEEERQIARMRNATERSRIPSIPQKTASTKSTASAHKTRGHDVPKGTAADIYDVPSDEPAPSSSRKPMHNLKRDKPIIPLAVSSSDAPRKRGRPSKSTALKNEKRLSNQAIRDAMVSEKEKAIAEEDGTATPRRRSVRKDREEESPAQSTPQPKASSAARRKERPARHSTDALEPEKELKSALTPLKKKRGRPRKSVVFEQTGEVDLGFKDLDTTTSTKKARTKIPVIEIHQSEDPALPHVEDFDEDAQSEDHEDNEASDEIACAMCRKFHSGRKNPIILCDKCNYAIHLKCSDLEAVPDEDESWCCELCAPDPNRDDVACAVCSRRNFSKKNTIILCEKCDFGIHLFCSEMEKVPRGVWLCKGCEPEPEPEDISFTKLRADATEVSSECPDIAGFEDYLRCMQRIVLDKLTGHRRTKLRGHEEEMQKVYQIVEQTILAGEGNSMLVIGARGCGKTTVRRQG